VRIHLGSGVPGLQINLGEEDGEEGANPPRVGGAGSGVPGRWYSGGRGRPGIDSGSPHADDTHPQQADFLWESDA
jgi:hypothetical protein